MDGPGRGGASSAAAALNTHIHMQPQVVLLADVGNLVDGVERAVDRGTGGGVHKEGHVTLQYKRGERGQTNNEQAERGGSVTHFLLGVNDFGLQVCRDDPPSEGAQCIRLSYKLTPRYLLTASIFHLSSVLSRITFSVPKPRAAPAFFME